MIRIHLFEFEDQSWLPSFFRDFITDHLRYAQRTIKPFSVICPKLKEIMVHCGQSKIMDLCSGAGGPVPEILRFLKEKEHFEVSAILSDKYPNIRALESLKDAHSDLHIDFIPEPIDATCVPDYIDGFRTMFSGFHHLRPRQAISVLRHAQEAKNGIGIFESSGNRSVSEVLKIVAGCGVFSLINTPRVGKLTFWRFLFTYILPIATLLFMWDGFVSGVRSYTIREMEQLANALSDSSYKWEVGELTRRAGSIGEIRITYLFGYPTEKGI